MFMRVFLSLGTAVAALSAFASCSGDEDDVLVEFQNMELVAGESDVIEGGRMLHGGLRMSTSLLSAETPSLRNV